MIKCLIWDLDETLWKGTLSENREVTLQPGIQEVLEALDKRGILQSIASRNDYNQAMNKLAQLGIDHYFLYPQMQWGTKVESIRHIVRELNIGMDAVAFIDDNPFELYEVNTYLPEVCLFRGDEYLQLLDYPEFQVQKITTEAVRRREMMHARDNRLAAEQQFAGSREEFLLSCSMELTVRLACSEDLDRVSELVARTNQMNNFLERVSDAVIRSYIESQEKRIYVAELQDRFGNHGIVSVAMIDFAETCAEIRLFCISCRIEGRGIGTAFLGTVLDVIQKQSPDMQEVNCGYRSESRNRPALILLKLLGFVRKEKREDYSIYMLTLPFSFSEPNWIRVHKMDFSLKDKEDFMSYRDTEQRVIEIVKGILGTQDVGTETVLLGNQGVLDSVTVVQLIVKLEQEFELVFDEDDLMIESLSSVDNIIRSIEAKE